MRMPWDKGLDPNQMLEDEMVRQLAIRQTSEPGSKEYSTTLVRYEKLHENALKESKLKEHRHARWFEGGVTGLLAISLLTVEQWTPLTSSWWRSITRPFRAKNDDLSF